MFHSSAWLYVFKLMPKPAQNKRKAYFREKFLVLVALSSGLHGATGQACIDKVLCNK